MKLTYHNTENESRACAGSKKYSKNKDSLISNNECCGAGLHEKGNSPKRRGDDRWVVSLLKRETERDFGCRAISRSWRIS
jgi:hypothetical protein